MRIRTVTVLASTLLLGLQPLTIAQSHQDRPSDPDHIPGQTDQVASVLDRQLTALANVVCHEQIERFAKKGTTTSQLDTLDTDVSVMNGMEKYSGIVKNGKTFQDLTHVKGTWSVGEVITLLRITRDAFKDGAIQVGQDDAAGLGRTNLMTFAYPASSQRWFLKVKSQLHWMSFEGKVWSSPETGEILRESWRASQLPPEAGVSEVVWTVDFKPVDIFARMLPLPREARFEVTYKPGENRTDWNVTRFSEYRRFGTDSAIHFD